MKQAMLETLKEFEEQLRRLRSDIKASTTARVNRADLRQAAEDLATMWVEEVRSPLEHRFQIPRDDIQEMAALMKRLHVLSRPKNRRTSYLAVLDDALKNFKDRFVLPIQQTSTQVDTALDLDSLITGLTSVEESEYLTEAVACAAHGFYRASIVMGWCAAIDRIQRRVQYLGFETFNKTSTKLKHQDKGRFKRFTKEFHVSTLSELQQVFDTDLLVILEGMELLDSNQADRMRNNFDYRNHSAHPGDAPIEETHVVSFFTDIVRIILTNPKFELA